MKKSIFILSLIIVLGLVGCSDKNLTFDIGEASKIHIKSGLSGDEVNITDKEFIQEITEDINSLRFEKTSTSNGKVGYAYMLTWLDTEDEPIARVMITDENGYQISHAGYYYKVGADLSIDVELIDDMLNISLSSEPTPSLTDTEVNKLIYGATYDLNADNSEYTVNDDGETLGSTG